MALWSGLLMRRNLTNTVSSTHTPTGEQMQTQQGRPSWNTRRSEKKRRLIQAAAFADSRVVPTSDIVPLLEALIAPGDRVVLEGNNQKQADFLSRSLALVDPAKVNGL